MHISLGGADVKGRPNRNAGDREGGAGGRNMARASTGDRCGAVGGPGRSGPGTVGLADSGRAAPMAKAVAGVALMATTRVASAAVPGTH
jgi:hypothetical protein